MSEAVEECIDCKYRQCSCQYDAGFKAGEAHGARRDWIPVSEQLPDQRQKVLFFNGVISCGEMMGPYWFTDKVEDQWPIPDVSHWMPLPTKPTQKEPGDETR